MTQTLSIPAQDRNHLYIFAVNLPEAEVKRRADNPDTISELLALADVDLQFAELLRLGDIADLGLADYLVEGYDVAPEALASWRARLGALEGYVVIVLSLGFKDAALDHPVPAALSYLGRIPTHAPDWHKTQNIETPSAMPTPTGKKQPSDAAIMGRVATIALLVLFALTGLIIWVAG